MLERLLKLLGIAGLSATTTAAASAAQGDAPPHAAAFLEAFDPGFAVDVDDAPEGEPVQIARTTFRVVPAGTLVVKSDRITTADPFVNLTDALPLVQPVPNGRFPVTLAVVAGGIAGHRVALARVVFSDAPVVR